MRTATTTQALIAGIVFMALGQNVPAQNTAGSADAAKNKVAMCVGCHGIPGYRTAYPDVYHVPRLGGQQPAYIVKALQAYRSGERSHPSMRGIAKGLSDKDMADFAAYYAGASK